VSVSDTETAKASATSKHKLAKANLDAKMVELRDAGKLEQSDENEHVYVFKDGDTTRECYIRNTIEVGLRNHKKAKADKPDLQVVPDGAGSGEID
jgi:hypothetical protein